MWAARAALKNPLCAERTVRWAEKCVRPGPTWSATSGAPGGAAEGGGGAGGGPSDSQALYNEYIPNGHREKWDRRKESPSVFDDRGSRGGFLGVREN